MYFNCSVTFVDSEKRSTVRRFGVVADDIAAAKALADAVISALADVSDAQITKANLTYEYDVIDAESGPSNVDAGMTMRVKVDPLLGPDKYAPFRIPAPKADLLDGKGGCVMDDTDLLALESALQAVGVYINNSTVIQFESGKLDK